MAHIYIISPSGAVRDRRAFQKGVGLLKSMGHDVELDPDVLKTHQRFAGDDDSRLASLHRACDSKSQVVITSRGGYGLTRLLDRLNYTKIKKAINQGCRFVGFSDFTAFQMAVLTKNQQITWAGPSVLDDLGKDLPEEIAMECLNDVIASQSEGTGWRMGLKAYKTFLAESDPKVTAKNVLAKDAVLWGGNLSVLCSLVGTPYFPTIKSGVLFLEDLAEHPYRVERMLTQLLHAGILDQQKAIVLGQFTQYKLTPHDRGFDLNAVISFLRSQTRVPLLTDLPFGHVPLKVCLPVGRRVSLIRDERELFLLWPHEHLGDQVHAHSHDHSHRHD
jgi:muramoyltetrapeptide carboxypeptidase